MNIHQHHPARRIWREHQRLMDHVSGYSGPILTLVLIGIGVVILWVAFRGSNRLKAATAVWTLFP